MKNLTYLAIILLCISACRNSDVTETFPGNPSIMIPAFLFNWSGFAGEFDPIWDWHDYEKHSSIPNLSISLIYKNDLLGITNTDAIGRFDFPNTAIPQENAYMLLKAPGYHDNVIKVDSNLIGQARILMIPNTLPDTYGNIFNDGGPYINITGQLPSSADHGNVWFYISNEDNELMGSGFIFSESSQRFKATALPNQELFIHYNKNCYSGVIPLGSYSADTDVGLLTDETTDFGGRGESFSVSNITDCNGENLSTYTLFATTNRLTQHFVSNVRQLECDLLAQPITIAATTQNPRKYHEHVFNYDSGSSNNINFTPSICDTDDTFMQYIIGAGQEVNSQWFTSANILPDGRIVIRHLEGNNKKTLIVDGSTIGTHNTKLTFYVSHTHSAVGNNINTTITLNDGEFIEGTISGELFNPEEVSFGEIGGTFRARIQ